MTIAPLSLLKAVAPCSLLQEPCSWVDHLANPLRNAFLYCILCTTSSLSCRYLSFVLWITKSFVTPFVSYVLFVDRVDIQPHTTQRLSFPFILLVLFGICFIAGILQHFTQLEGITIKRKSLWIAHSDTVVPTHLGILPWRTCIGETQPLLLARYTFYQYPS